MHRVTNQLINFEEDTLSCHSASVPEITADTSSLPPLNWVTFFEGLYSQTLKTLKTSKLKTRKIKFLMEEEIPSRTKWGVGWTSIPPTLQKFSLPAERILSALPRCIAIVRFWWNQLTSLGSRVTSTKRGPIALRMTSVDSPYTNIVSTAIGSLMCLCKSSIFTAFALLGAVCIFCLMICLRFCP